MNASELVSLLQKKSIGPRVEIVLGEAVLLDLDLVTRFRVEQQNGAITFYDAKPRFNVNKEGWPKIEQVTCAEIKTGAPKVNPATRSLAAG